MKPRKQFICVVLLFFVFSPLRPGFAAYSPVLTLTETNGASIEGTILSYSTKTDSVKVKTKEGPVQRPLSALTEESRKSLLLWQEDQDFLKDSKLSVEFSEQRTFSSTNVYGIVERKTNTVIGYANRSFCSHKIKLTCKSDYSFKDLQIDCRVYYSQPLPGNSSCKFQLCTRTNCAALQPGSPVWTFSTTPVVSGVAYREASGINWINMPKDVDIPAEGVLLRIQKKGVTGEWVVKEVEIGDVPSGRNRRNYQKIYKCIDELAF